MSLLADFGAGFFGTMGQQFGQQADDQRRLALQEALERRRRAMQLEDEERARRQKREDFVEMQNVQAEPRVGYDAEGKPSILRSTFALDDAGKLTRNDQRIGDPVMRPTGETKERKSGGDFVTMEKYSDGLNTEWREVDRAPRLTRSGESAPRGERGLTPYQEEQLKRGREKEARDLRVKRSDFIDKRVKETLADFESSDFKYSDPLDGAPGTGAIAGLSKLNDIGAPTDIRNMSQLRSWARQQAEAEANERYGMGEEESPETAKPDSPSKPSKKDPNKPPVPGAIKHPNGKWYVKQADGWYEVEEEG